MNLLPKTELMTEETFRLMTVTWGLAVKLLRRCFDLSNLCSAEGLTVAEENRQAFLLLHLYFIVPLNN